MPKKTIFLVVYTPTHTGFGSNDNISISTEDTNTTTSPLQFVSQADLDTSLQAFSLYMV